ncbi:hypothetical protein PG991_010278 [Apiospora marii]|uniref:Uncharacterized protein n=1 Tax=Apiospora marii TaxID=335849 RepID=A0ABR1RI91_9PEZI
MRFAALFALAAAAGTAYAAPVAIANPPTRVVRSVLPIVDATGAPKAQRTTVPESTDAEAAGALDSDRDPELYKVIVTVVDAAKAALLDFPAGQYTYPDYLDTCVEPCRARAASSDSNCMEQCDAVVEYNFDNANLLTLRSTGAPKAPRLLIPFPNYYETDPKFRSHFEPEVLYTPIDDGDYPYVGGPKASKAPKARRQLIPATNIDVSIQDYADSCFKPCLESGEDEAVCSDKCAPLTDNMDADAKLQVSSGLDLGAPKARRQSVSSTDDEGLLDEHKQSTATIPRPKELGDLQEAVEDLQEVVEDHVEALFGTLTKDHGLDLGDADKVEELHHVVYKDVFKNILKGVGIDGLKLPLDLDLDIGLGRRSEIGSPEEADDGGFVVTDFFPDVGFPIVDPEVITFVPDDDPNSKITFIPGATEFGIEDDHDNA